MIVDQDLVKTPLPSLFFAWHVIIPPSLRLTLRKTGLSASSSARRHFLLSGHFAASIFHFRMIHQYREHGPKHKGAQ